MPTTPDDRNLTVAAVLLVENGWTDQQIADYLGISRRTLARWKDREDVALAMAACRMLRSRSEARAEGVLRRQCERLEEWYGPHSPTYQETHGGVTNATK